MGRSERRFLQGGSMEVLVGFCPMGKGAPAVGRLIFCKEGSLPPLHGAFLSVFRQPPVSVSDCEGQMGMILVGSSALSSEQLTQISCPILMLPELPESCLGKIGLLDPSSATLFVSPDLPTMTRYTEYWNREKLSAIGATDVRADGKLLRWEELRSGSLTLEEAEWLVDCRRAPLPRTDAEELWYERYCDIADCAVGTPVTVVAAFDRGASEQLAFRAMIRGLFRAAVYGSFSILVSGCLTEADVRSAREELHRAFCDLESEGREFNGYISKGILVDRPVLLFSAHSFEGVDFICLEMEELFYGFTGRHVEEGAETDGLWRMLEPILSDWKRQGKDVRACAMLRAVAPSYALCHLLWRCGIWDCFFLGSDFFETKTYLRELAEEHRETFEKFFQEKGEKISKST